MRSQAKRKRPQRQEIVQPTIYQPYMSWGKPSGHEGFDRTVSIVEQGNSVVTDYEGNLVEVRKIDYRQLTPGTYYRFGDTLLKEKEDCEEEHIMNQYILDELKLRREQEGILRKIQSYSSRSARKHDIDDFLREKENELFDRKFERAIEQLSGRILNESSAKQYIFDRTKVSMVERKQISFHSNEQRLQRIKEVSDEVIDKYFAIVKRRKGKTRGKALQLSRMRELQKQKEVEQFIKTQLMLNDDEEVQAPQKRTPATVRSRPKNQSARVPAKLRSSERRATIRRVQDVQSDLVKVIAPSYKQHLEKDFYYILNSMQH